LIQRLPPAATASGLYTLRVLSNERVLVRVCAEASSSLEAPGPGFEPQAASSGIPRLPLSPEVYPQPQKRIQASYTVGARWTFVNVGRKPLAGRDEERQLAGNYGVFYDISLELANPTDRERTVQLLLSPAAGDARGVFVIDGRIVEAPPVAPPAEVVLARVRIKPAERRVLSIRTMPVGGSAYPVSLVVRS
jgi:hypothetical protein